MSTAITQSWKLSPSDFTFLYEECQRCFYLKVVEGRSRPWMPFPGVFKKIDSAENKFFAGKSSKELSPTLPDGIVQYGEMWVEPGPVAVPVHRDTCFIRGRFDVVVQFEDGTFGVVDFKTTETKEPHVPLYSRQLHAYALALENPAQGKLHLAPISRLGLFCLDPMDLIGLEPDSYALRMAPTWIEVPRDDTAFREFLGEVLDVLELPNPPPPGADCGLCKYLATNQGDGLVP